MWMYEIFLPHGEMKHILGTARFQTREEAREAADEAAKRRGLTGYHIFAWKMQ